MGRNTNEPTLYGKSFNDLNSKQPPNPNTLLQSFVCAHVFLPTLFFFFFFCFFVGRVGFEPRTYYYILALLAYSHLLAVTHNFDFQPALEFQKVDDF
jgi:hypothetical protein